MFHNVEPRPLVFIDTETTGLDPNSNALISLAAIILGGPHSGEHTTVHCRPHPGAVINSYAMQANGYSAEEIADWPDPTQASDRFTYWLIERLDDQQLCHPAGWNFAFDDRFMRSWLTRHNTPSFYGNTFTDTPCDVMALFKVQYPQYKSDPRFGNAKLTTVHAGLFGTVHKDAHTEFSDAYATMRVFLHLAEASQSPTLAPYLQCKLPL